MKKVWEKWKDIAERVGAFQARVIFTILYFLIITPVGSVISAFTDYLDVKSFPKWNIKETHSKNLEELKEQS